MILPVKNMISNQCKRIVKSELNQLGIYNANVELGEIEFPDHICEEKQRALKNALSKTGFELVDGKKAILVEKIKKAIVEFIHPSDERPKINFSEFISDQLPYDYTYLANLFTDVTCNTIEHYMISNKIECVKELLLYEHLNLTEISYKLNYSSVAHLSNQFKKVTGLTPSLFIQRWQRTFAPDLSLAYSN